VCGERQRVPIAVDRKPLPLRVGLYFGLVVTLVFLKLVSLEP
jgi:hypothetical protein